MSEKFFCMKPARFFYCLFVLVLAMLLFQSCRFVSGEVTLGASTKPFEKLSEYHFFKGEMNLLQPNKQVLPYDLISSLFTDYAHKARFVYLPENTSASYQTEDALDLPVGGCYIKNFYYPFDFRDEKKGRKIIETRLLIHRENGWEALPYIWNDEQTEATLQIAGDVKSVSWINHDGAKKEIDYVVPNKNQCKSCHWNNVAGSISPIGPKVRNLNHDFTYADGTQNQLAKWAAVGFLNGAPTDISSCPKMADYNNPQESLDSRARAYLEINCAHCHKPTGPAYTSGLFLNYENENPEHLGICKSPVAAGKGTGGFLADIVPGNHKASILSFRMESNDAGIRMPELGRTVIHQEGVALINQWIDAMQASNCSGLVK